MERITDRMEELFVAAIFSCIVLFGLAATICVSTADLVRKWKPMRGRRSRCPMPPDSSTACYAKSISGLN
jgi:hypothetical protein